MENQNQDDERNDINDSNSIHHDSNYNHDINGSGSGSVIVSNTPIMSQNGCIEYTNDNDTTTIHVQPNLTGTMAHNPTTSTATTTVTTTNNDNCDSKTETHIDGSNITSAMERVQRNNAFNYLNQNVDDNTSLSYTTSGSNRSNTGISLDPSISSVGSGIGNNNDLIRSGHQFHLPLQQQQHHLQQQQQNMTLHLQQPPSSPEKVQQVTQRHSPNHISIQQQSNDNLHLTQQMTPSTNTTPSQYTNVQYINTSPQHSESLPLQPLLQIANQHLQQEQPQVQSQPMDATLHQQEATIDSILNSPKTKDEIVEKSPGGRYIRFSEKLGSGAYKDVYRAYDTIEGIEVAWNVVNLTGVPKSERQYIVNEVRLLEQLNHSNIISFHGSWVNRELEQVIFVTEILSSGTLKSFITKVQVIRWRIAKRWAKKILKGIEYLHSHNPPIVHRDLKCDNIFINGTSGDLRIGDLGLSTFISNSTEKKGMSVLGTPEFMAPDLYNESYDQTIDIYAFGMCMLEIFTKEIPYRECSNPAQIYKKVTAGVEPDSIDRIQSIDAREFIRLCLGRPNGHGGYLRPSATELLNHPFLADKDDDDSEILVDPPMMEVAIPEGPALSGLTDATAIPPIQRRTSINDFQSDGEVETEPKTSIAQTNDSLGGTDLIGIPNQGINLSQVVQSSSVIAGSRQQSGEELVSNHGIFNNANTSPQNVPKQQMQVKITGPPLSSRPPLPPSPKPIRWVVNIVDLTEVENPGILYEGDILRLRLTLALDNPNKQVQFDFHLINDDPIAVAHEMVTELNLPKEAALEISETISSMVNSARLRQEQFQNQQASQQQQVLQSHLSSIQQDVSLIDSHDVSPEQQTNLDDNPHQVTNVPFNLNLLQQQHDLSSQLSGVHPMAHQPFLSSVDVPHNQANDAPQQNVLLNNTTTFNDENGNAIAHAISNNETNTVDLKALSDSNDPKCEQSDFLQSNTTISLVDGTDNESATAEMMISNLDLCTNIDVEMDGDSANNLSEIMKLKLDYQNKVLRANKAYQTRMEKMLRSKEAKEALHLQTVEKHEKERLAFEKRVKQAEMDQKERLQKFTEEFEQMAEALQSKQLTEQGDLVADTKNSHEKEISDKKQSPTPFIALEESDCRLNTIT